MQNQITALLGVLLWLAMPAAAQTGAKAAAKVGYNAPRTAWGDPDISGNYTNKYEQGTPFERPPELEGRRLRGDQRRGARRRS